MKSSVRGLEVELNLMEFMIRIISLNMLNKKRVI